MRSDLRRRREHWEVAVFAVLCSVNSVDEHMCYQYHSTKVRSSNYKIGCTLLKAQSKQVERKYRRNDFDKFHLCLLST